MRLVNKDPCGFILEAEPYIGRCIWLWKQKGLPGDRHFITKIDIADDRALLSIGDGLGTRIA